MVPIKFAGTRSARTPPHLRLASCCVSPLPLDPQVAKGKSIIDGSSALLDIWALILSMRHLIASLQSHAYRHPPVVQRRPPQYTQYTRTVYRTMNGFHILDETFFHVMLRSALGMGVPRSLTQGHDWRYSAEKSAAAQRRENEAKNKFNYLNNQMDLALYENTMTTIGLACHAKSDSPLKLLPQGVMNSVLAFVGCTKPGLMPGVKASLDRRTNNNAIVPFAGLGTPESQLNLGDVSLFHPGSKLVIPFSKVSMNICTMHSCLQV